ncbi:hypothetical protein MBLNU457_5714t1 [Dothideomycetes sp. NU457]
MNPARSLTNFVCASCRRADVPQAVRRPFTLRQFQTSSRTAASERNEMEIDNLFGSLIREKEARTSGRRGPPRTASKYLDNDAPPKNPLENLQGMYQPKYKLHVYSTKHNTHMTLTAPVPQKASNDNNPYAAPEPNKVVLSLSAGNIGFRKAGRGSYDAAFQLTAFVTKQIKERGLLRDIEMLEVVLRGFGAGREAVTKALLGVEGKNIRPLITSVVDATRLKFGGPRSPKPRRLG